MERVIQADEKSFRIIERNRKTSKDFFYSLFGRGSIKITLTSNIELKIKEAL